MKALVSDLSGVLLFRRDDPSKGDLNLYFKTIKPKDFFWDYFKLNTELLQYYDSLKEKMTLAIFTSGSIQKFKLLKSELSKTFVHIISMYEIGIPKHDPRAYKHVAKILEVDPESTMYIDDKKVNCMAAKEAFMKSILYTTTTQTMKDIEHKVHTK